MRTRTGIALAVAAGLVGAAAVGVPAVLAADDDPPRDGGRWGGPMWADRDDARGMGPWMMRGRDGRGPGGGPGGGFGGRRGGLGGGPGLCGWGGEAAGTLTGAQEETLADLAEREKLARDVYTSFADATGDVRFRRVAWSEAHHLRALQGLLDRYEVDDPTRGSGTGEFEDAQVAADYERYVEEGSGSLDAALEAALEIESGDVDRLGEAASDVEESAPDVALVYEHLALASAHHRSLFAD
jgi:hypothetical protein